ncbi:MULTISPECIES: response regulator transcription factor [Hydrocarboniphaga]|jgi:two-component system invasion response regulator UvrY|nr:MULTISPECIES: response regulator transcription factor [Hydrocarboniphaga]MDZ4081138.1 response regulator transcription factor [Hydrocarboniphaga sp.]
MSRKIRVMLVDDHAMVRMGFRMLLGGTQDIEVICEAEDGEAAYQLFPEIRPDVVVMDLSMPGMGGIEALRRLTARDREARVLVLSAHEDSAHPRRALKAGAMGYVSKRSAPEELIDAVRSVGAGRIYLGVELARKLAVQELHGAANPVESLSEREFAVFLQLAKGQSVAQIAETLHLSPNTVGTHLYNIKQKLGVGNQAELTLIAVRNGLLDV